MGFDGSVVDDKPVHLIGVDTYTILLVCGIISRNSDMDCVSPCEEHGKKV